MDGIVRTRSLAQAVVHILGLRIDEIMHSFLDNPALKDLIIPRTKPNW